MKTAGKLDAAGRFFSLISPPPVVPEKAYNLTSGNH
jgi:hypothetical protein